MFPIQLAEDHVISWSKEGDLVFDPFTGSGTTAVAALKNGRRFLGSEKSTEYFEIAKKRISTEVPSLRMNVEKAFDKKKEMF